MNESTKKIVWSAILGSLILVGIISIPVLTIRAALVELTTIDY